MTTLPDKPSELIRLALKDLEACERSPNYFVDMDTWHKPLFGQCAVCLAGAVMARTLGINRDADVSPPDLGAATDDRLSALDALRLGEIGEALVNLNIARPPEMPARVPMACYHDGDPADFKNDMFELATLFEWHGL